MNDESAIREAELPAWRRDSHDRRPSLVSLVAFWVGTATAAGVLCAAAQNVVGFSIAKPLFVVGLLIAFSASISVLKSAAIWGCAGFFIVLALVAFSFAPLYIKHVGDPERPQSHRHMLWWPDHVH